MATQPPSENPETLDPAAKPTALKGVVIGMLTGVAFGLGGFLFLRDEKGAMGSVLFLMLPIAAGFAVALVTSRPELVNACLIVATLLCFAILLIIGAEGIVCVLMASPLIAGGLLLGAVCGRFFKRYVLDKSGTPGTLKILALLLTPLFLIGANYLEEPHRRTPREETFVTTLTVDATPESVWEQIKRVDSISADKPFLMKIGLPVPVSCVLEGEAVGGRRTCYFDSGYIEERIVEWNPPVSMKLEIVAVTLPGRHWLGFKGASYEIQRDGDKTRLIRRTTIISRLYPAWYWRPLEGLGVQAEHEYLFADVARKLSKRE
ncbi:MAG TPA: hypothetical protein VJT09_18375 [Pyrinomonadaceae bacterium]|nr:hypothetical protein [Pyrinomonadaceae bacterium]